MVRQRAHERPRPWEDRFNPPTPETLRGALPDAAAVLFDEARRELRNLTEGSEAVVWNGACWRWTLDYRVPTADKPLAVIIPNPEDLQLAIPVEDAFVKSIWKRRMKRTLRDGLELAAEPYDNEWCVWSLASQSMLEELLDLIQEKLDFGRAASASS